MNLNLGWTRSVLQYILARRYANSCEAPPMSSPVSLLAADERQAFCDAQGLGPYRGGEVLPDLRATQATQESIGEPSPQTTATAESLMRAAFVCVSLGEEKYLLPLMEEIAK